MLQPFLLLFLISSGEGASYKAFLENSPTTHTTYFCNSIFLLVLAQGKPFCCMRRLSFRRLIRGEVFCRFSFGLIDCAGDGGGSGWAIERMGVKQASSLFWVPAIGIGGGPRPSIRHGWPSIKRMARSYVRGLLRYYCDMNTLTIQQCRTKSEKVGTFVNVDPSNHGGIQRCQQMGLVSFDCPVTALRVLSDWVWVEVQCACWKLLYEIERSASHLDEYHLILKADHVGMRRIISLIV